MKMAETAREPVLVDLALQGGDSHGAFTWQGAITKRPWPVSRRKPSSCRLLRNGGTIKMTMCRRHRPLLADELRSDCSLKS
jgi:hypothetical protein